MSLIPTTGAPGTLGLAQAQATLKDADRYYRWLTWATVPLHFVALIACAWWGAWWQLTSANDVEHYGLLRHKSSGTGYEAPQPHHSCLTPRRGHDSCNVCGR